MFLLSKLGMLFAFLSRQLMRLSDWAASQTQKSKAEANVALGALLQILIATMAVLTIFFMSGMMFGAFVPALIGISGYGLFVLTALSILKALRVQSKRHAGWTLFGEVVVLMIWTSLFMTQLSRLSAVVFMYVAGVLFIWKLFACARFFKWGLFREKNKQPAPAYQPAGPSTEHPSWSPPSNSPPVNNDWSAPPPHSPPANNR